MVLKSVQDQPGHLAALLAEIAAAGGNVISVTHDRISSLVPLGRTGAELLVEARDAAHGDEILSRLQAKGYGVRRLVEE